MLVGFVLIVLLACKTSLAACPAGCHCPRRQTAECNANQLIDAPRPDGTIEVLFAIGNHIHSLRRNAFLGAASLREIYLDNNTLTHIDRDAFRGLTGLDLISLENNDLQILEADTFRYTRGLRSVNLFGNRRLVLPDNGPFLKLPSLFSLNISSCGLSYLPQHTFTKSSSKYRDSFCSCV